MLADFHPRMKKWSNSHPVRRKIGVLMSKNLKMHYKDQVKTAKTYQQWKKVNFFIQYIYLKHNDKCFNPKWNWLLTATNLYSLIAFTKKHLTISKEKKISIIFIYSLSEDIFLWIFTQTFFPNFRFYLMSYEQLMDKFFSL